MAATTCYVHTVFAQMDAVATIIFRSGKTWCLFEGCYNYMRMQRYVYTDIIACIVFTARVASQVNKAILFRHHCVCVPHLQDSLGSAEVSHVLCELSLAV